jgi:hypothetical protein
VRDYTSDLQTNRIPILVNGHVSPIKKVDNNLGMSDKVSYLQNLLRESSLKLQVNKNIFFNHHKHKVLLTGDSHLRGCAPNMKDFLNDQFEVCGFVKPAAVSKTVMEYAKSDIEKLTMDDFLIMCNGTNDIGRNDYKEVFVMYLVL